MQNKTRLLIPFGLSKDDFKSSERYGVALVKPLGICGSRKAKNPIVQTVLFSPHAVLCSMLNSVGHHASPSCAVFHVSNQFECFSSSMPLG